MASSDKLRVTLPKRSLKERVVHAKAVTVLVESSAFAQAHPEVLASAAKLGLAAGVAEGAQGDVEALEGKLITARQFRDDAVSALYAATDHYRATVLVDAKTPADVKSAGLEVTTITRYALLTPGNVYAVYNKATRLVDLSLDLVPGINTYRYRHSPDPRTDTSWEHVPGVSATRSVRLPPGIHWFDVASTRGSDESAFVDPVSVVVP